MTVVGLGLGGLLTAAASSAVFAPIASAASEVVEGEVVAASGGVPLPLIVAGCVALQVVLFSTMQSKYEKEGGASH